MSTTTVDLSDLFRADLVKVTDNLNHDLCRVVDPDQIRQVGEFLAGREAGWSVPETGVRVMKVRLNFFAGDTSMGSVGLGRKYLTAQRRGQFYQRDAEPGDREALLAIVGMNDPAG